jgi:hypothetical protein
MGGNKVRVFSSTPGPFNICVQSLVEGDMCESYIGVSNVEGAENCSPLSATTVGATPQRR